MIASLAYAAQNPQTLLKNFYQKGVNSLRKGREESPKAFVIPKAQRDPAMAAYMVNQLMGQAIEVHENDSDYVVLLEQPYRNLAVNLLTRQNYPKEAKFPPYDGIAWTLGLLNGVEVVTKDSLDFEVATLKMLPGEAKYAGKVQGEGNVFVIKYTAQNTVLPALYALQSQQKNLEIKVLKSALIHSGDTLTAGSIVLPKLTDRQVEAISKNFELDLIRSTINDDAQLAKVNLPKVAVYHTWYNTQDEGWTRFTFEKRGIPYTSIDKDDLKRGNLRSRFDVILIPRVRGSAQQFIHGVDKKYGPMPYTKTAEFPSHGFPASTPDMTGGPGFLGMEQLKKFVEDGGLLITMDNSSQIIADAGITTELLNVDQGALFHPGSIVQAKARNNGSPILYGYPEYFSIYRGNGPLLQTSKYNKSMMLVQYGTKPLKEELPYEGPVMGLPEKPKTAKVDKSDAKDMPYVLSGMVRNEDKILGHGAVFAVPVGKGNVVAFTFDPLHRYLNHHDAPMVWNALINWDRLRP